jgi:hypothetical protein
MKPSRALLLVLCLTLGVAFLYAGMVKARRPYRFLADIYEYRMVSPEVAKWVAIVLPGVELAAAAGMCFAGTRRGALLLMCWMLCGFLLIQASVMWRGLSIHCSCFGSESTVGLATMGRTGLLTLMSIVAIWQHSKLHDGACGFGVDGQRPS